MISKGFALEILFPYSYRFSRGKRCERCEVVTISRQTSREANRKEMIVEEKKLIVSIFSTCLTIHNSCGGNLAIYKVPWKQLYQVQYDERRKSSLICELPAARCDPSQQRIYFLESSHPHALIRHSFHIEDPKHFKLFECAYNECISLYGTAQELILKMQEVYTKGVETCFQTTNFFDPNEIQKETESLQCNTIQEFDEFSAEFFKGIDASDQNLSSATSSPQPVSSALKCFYCQTTNTSLEKPFIYHPFVSKDFQGNCLFLCSNCYKNWSSYRQSVALKNELIPSPDQNEDICSLCSDSPDSLILCSSCPRAFCTECLKKLISSKKELDQIISSDRQWKCMSCLHQQSQGQSKSLLLSRNTWKYASQLLSGAISVGHYQRTQSLLLDAADNEGSAGQAATKKDLVGKKTKLRRQVSDSTRDSESSQRSQSPSAPPLSPSQDGSSQVTKRQRTPKSQESEKVTALLVPPSSSSTKKKILGPGRGRRKKIVQEEQEKRTETYYFRQYLNYLDELYSSPREDHITDDACFLCKDGGNVLECDYCYSSPAPAPAPPLGPGPSGQQKCLKVYHQSCLGFTVSEEVQFWCCPRHYCSCCGHKERHSFVCMFCPISICSACPEAFMQKVRPSSFLFVSS